MTEKILFLLAGMALVLMGMGIFAFLKRPRPQHSPDRLSRRSRKQKPDLSQFSKWMIADIRPLLWIVTIGGFLLAFYCVYEGYTGALPWIGAMVGLPWTAHGVVCSFYLNLCKSDHREGGITFETAKATNFNMDLSQTPVGSVESPAI